MDLRTFLPPPRLETAPTPRPGDAAPAEPARAPGRPAVVAFLRHAGCPFAEATMAGLRDRSASDQALDWIAVSHAPEPATGEWCAAVGGAGSVRMISDPDRWLYAAWGVGRTDVGHFAGPRSLASVVGQARRGIRNRHPHGSRWQGAATFALGADGTVRWRHLPAHAGDLPDLAAAARAATLGGSSDGLTPV